MEITDMTVKILGGICIAYGILALWEFTKQTPQDSNSSTLDEDNNTSKLSLFDIILALVLCSWIISSFIAKVTMIIGIGILFWSAIGIWTFHLLGLCMIALVYQMASGKNISKDKWGTPIEKIKKSRKNEMITQIIVLSWMLLWFIADIAVNPQAHPASLLCQYFS